MCDSGRLWQTKDKSDLLPCIPMFLLQRLTLGDHLRLSPLKLALPPAVQS